MSDISNSNDYLNENEIETVDSFENMGLSQNIMRGIFSYGYERPSQIQSKGIPALLKKRDVIAQAQSGTGKTATFSISLLNKIDQTHLLKALILVPTRELATQIHNVIKAIGSYSGIKICLCIGGDPVRSNIDNIRQTNPQILVCTPGRLLDLIEKRGLKVDNVEDIVIDEADEMLSKGFKDQIYWIFQKMPEKSNVALFSATMPQEMFELADKFMRNPIKILVKKDSLTLEGIKQYFVEVDRPEFKLDVLIDLYDYIQVSQAMIYCNEKKRVDYLSRKLIEKGFTVSCIHGNLQAKERIDIMESFRKGDTRILISTDLLARGIDIQQVSLVINFELSLSKENYIHRIGRSGRFGRKGVAINLVTNYEVQKLNEIERFYNTQISELPSDLSSVFG